MPIFRPKSTGGGGNKFMGVHKSAERIRGITIFGNSGHNFTSGKITLFGVK